MIGGRDLGRVAGPRVNAFCCACIGTKGDEVLKYLTFTVITTKHENALHNKDYVWTLGEQTILEKCYLSSLDCSS